MDDHGTPTPTDGPGSSGWATAAWIVASLVLVVFVVGVWMRVDDRNAGAQLTNAIVKGKRPAAPALPTDPVTSGSELPDTTGQVLVVNWWASWCGPCKEEMPALQSLANDYDGKVAFVGINAGEEDLRSDARAFAKQYEVRYPLVRGDRADKDAWGVTMFPETFVVGVDGRISSYIVGPVEERDLRELVDAELREDRA